MGWRIDTRTYQFLCFCIGISYCIFNKWTNGFLNLKEYPAPTPKSSLISDTSIELFDLWTQSRCWMLAMRSRWQFCNNHCTFPAVHLAKHNWFSLLQCVGLFQHHSINVVYPFPTRRSLDICQLDSYWFSITDHGRFSTVASLYI